MAAPQLFVIVDDSCSDSFVFGPLEWTRTGLPEEFNSTSQTPTFALDQAGPLGNMKMGFNGISVALFGNTPPGTGAPRTFAVSIDGTTPYYVAYTDPSPPTYMQWYQSPLLEEGDHNISLSNIAGGASVDFAVVSVGEDTPLSDTLIITDNDDLAFNYTGQWLRSQHAFISGLQKPNGNPYYNSTHQTSDVGSFFTYQFTGNSVAVYGIFTWSTLGMMSLTFTLDGESLSQTYDVRPDTPQLVSGEDQQQNFLFYEYSFLQTGSHTLMVNLTECVNQTFAFDYVTFTPSFTTLATMPNGTTAVYTEQMISKNSHTGVIAAGLGAAIIVLLLVGIFVFFRRRKQVDEQT
ncbi:hypothetical protein HYPSUDRAFT_70381 [Hypholoma sublateritium FD-334 SS-4]|uniref:Uncharacterized protein n=1 Tax=Hypholoma sublateritium (strain FD-334 SS-4) TaxID=945553 RepID=A0A0D2NFX2_HYPSF|nr:hypothetical protein HYPSUDRAFT_70381 [Hypholoma sublateritium FD-334 SS-4]